MPNILQRIRSAAEVLVRGNAWERYFDQPGRGGARADELTQPFKNSVWVQRAIKKISGPISSVPFYFTDENGAEIKDRALDMIWNDPAKCMTRADFIEATVGWLKLEGEAFWILPDEWRVPFPEVGGAAMRGKLIIARPDRMMAVMRGDELVAWTLTDARGQRHTLLPDELVHLKYWNPYDPIRGMSEYAAANVAADADHATGIYNRNLMRAAGDQGVYVIAKSGNVNDEQRRQITEQLRMKRDLSMRGQFRPTFLSGDVTIEDAKVQPLDANIIAARLQNRHEVFMAFGVPPSMADVKASYSIGSASDYFMLIHETCAPTGQKICSAVESIVARMAPGRGVRVAFDWDDHPVMQEVRRERADTAVKLWGVGMPMEKINDYLGLDMPEFDGWDVGYLPFSVAPVGSKESALPDQDAAFTQGADAEGPANPVQEMLRALRGGEDFVCPYCGVAFDYSAQPEVCMGSVKCPHCGEICSQCEAHSDAAVFQRGRPAREVALWKSHAAKRKAVIKIFESKFNRVLFDARAETLRKIEAHYKPEAKAVTRAAGDFMFDGEKFKKALVSVMRQATQRALDQAGTELMQELGKNDPWKYPPQKAVEVLAQRENKMKGVADDVFERIKEQITQGITDGDSIEGMANRIKDTFNDISDGKARVVASTETSAAYGAARDEAMKDAGVRWKQWLTSGLPNVRAAHAAANGQTVPVDEPFHVGGEDLEYPGDPSGEPGNVINCHCVSVAAQEPN
jgi:HK97 family phage portal protein